MSVTIPAHVRAQKVIDEVRGVKAEYGISSVAWKFLNDLVERRQIGLTVKQGEWLRELEHKAFRVGRVE